MNTIIKAEQIAIEISARLATILKANGCETDIGIKGYRGRRKIDDKAPPCHVVIEGEDTSVEDVSGRGIADAHLMQRYVLVGYGPCDPDHPNDAAHAMIRDIKRAIFRTEGKTDATFGRKVRSIHYRGRDIGPRADGLAIVMVVVEIDVEFAEDLSNP